VFRQSILPLLVLAASLLTGGAGAPDIILVNGRVYTGLPARPWAEAIAIEGDRIVTVGTTADIRAQSTSLTRVIDVAGKLVIPGGSSCSRRGR
jgi:imidazolonepropionase-like amidohydrolase